MGFLLIALIFWQTSLIKEEKDKSANLQPAIKVSCDSSGLSSSGALPAQILSWANPETRKKNDASVRKFFKAAMRNEDSIKAAVGVSSKYGFTRENTLFAHSYCPDEINHEKGDISEYLTTYFSEYFGLGGLAGIPFVGKTGFGAFAAHVPEEGNIFVLFAPHVAVSEEGKVGYYKRLF